MSAPYIQANTNGRLHSASEPSLSPLDRGFLYGDAIYEVWRTYEGVVFAWEEHGERLGRSAAALGLVLPWTADDLWREVARTAAAYRVAVGRPGELYVRLQVSRGGGPIGLDVALADRPTFVILVQACPENSAQALAGGIALATAAALRRNPIESLSPAWKTGNYLNNVLGLREARARGADDVVMLNLRGEVTEASTSNLAFVRGGEVFTPPLEAGILEGITRAMVLRRVAPAIGLRVREQVLRPGDLAGMEECFLLSTTKEVLPVRLIDGHRFAVGPASVTRRVRRAYLEHVRAAVAAAPHRRI
jgi:branched-subunit amino acid aminotransferase/4-amino-4-deoxychorismate lyase